RPTGGFRATTREPSDASSRRWRSSSRPGSIRRISSTGCRRDAYRPSASGHTPNWAGGGHSAVLGDADLAAPGEDGAGRAVRALAGAAVLAERDEKAVDVEPVPMRQLPLEGDQRLLRGPLVDVAPAVDDAVDVDVDADTRLVAGDPHHQIGALRSDAAKGAQH